MDLAIDLLSNLVKQKKIGTKMKKVIVLCFQASNENMLILENSNKLRKVDWCDCCFDVIIKTLAGRFNQDCSTAYFNKSYSNKNSSLI